MALEIAEPTLANAVRCRFGSRLGGSLDPPSLSTNATALPPFTMAATWNEAQWLDFVTAVDENPAAKEVLVEVAKFLVSLKLSDSSALEGVKDDELIAADNAPKGIAAKGLMRRMVRGIATRAAARKAGVVAAKGAGLAESVVSAEVWANAIAPPKPKWTSLPCLRSRGFRRWLSTCRRTRACSRRCGETRKGHAPPLLRGPSSLTWTSRVRSCCPCG